MDNDLTFRAIATLLWCGWVGGFVCGIVFSATFADSRPSGGYSPKAGKGGSKTGSPPPKGP